MLLPASEVIAEAIKAPVVVFSKSYCPYCDKAKEALTAVGAKFDVLELDEYVVVAVVVVVAVAVVDSQWSSRWRLCEAGVQMAMRFKQSWRRKREGELCRTCSSAAKR